MDCMAGVNKYLNNDVAILDAEIDYIPQVVYTCWL